MILPPCLSLVLALVPTAQEPTSAITRPWIALPPEREFSTLSIDKGALRLGVLDAPTGEPLHVDWYDSSTWQDEDPVATSTIKGDGSDSGLVHGRGPVDAWIKSNGYQHSPLQFSEKRDVALIIERPLELGGTARLILVSSLGLEHAVETKARMFPTFVNAVLTTDGSTVYAQVFQKLEQWTARAFLDDDGWPRCLAISGEQSRVHVPGTPGDSKAYDFFLLNTPTALEVFAARRSMPPGLSLPPRGGPVPIEAAFGIIPTSNFATSAGMDQASGFVVVTERDRAIVKRLTGENKLEPIAEFPGPEDRDEFREARIEVRSSTFSAGKNGEPLIVVLGLRKDPGQSPRRDPSTGQFGAWVLEIDPAREAKPRVILRTPWLNALRWNGLSPELLLTEDRRMLFLMTRGRCWRFKVAA